MYYLDFTSLYRVTTKDERRAVRKSLDRNSIMEKKLMYQHNTCFYCTEKIDMSAHLDHVIPVYRGGGNYMRNLVAACRSCNLTKGTDIIEISNPYTIKDYQNLIKAKKKHEEKLKEKGVKSLAYIPKRVQLYTVYRADLFKHLRT